jgi:hypothetical protein
MGRSVTKLEVGNGFDGHPATNLRDEPFVGGSIAPMKTASFGFGIPAA